MKKRFLNGKYWINEDHFRVAIFGSARIKKGGSRYNQVRRLAKMIAEENMDIVTGGGPGLMEAANSGHKEGSKKHKTHSFGLTIKLPKEQKTNKHLDIRKDFNKFSQRLDEFMILSNAVVVAPGGLGTTLEFFYALQLTQVKHICDIPIILMGKQWKPLINWIENYPLKRGFLNKEDLHNIFIAKDEKQAMEILKMTHEQYLKGDKNACINIKKYRI